VWFPSEVQIQHRHVWYGLLIVFSLFFFLWDVSLNPGLHARKARDLLLESLSSSFCSGSVGDGGLSNYLPGLALNLHPPALSLLSSYDQKHEPLVPGCF
jgi:hypothetical protein